MENTYSNAYTEVLEILKSVPKEQYEKIPKEEIDFLEKNRNKDYIFSYDIENPNTLRKTDAILVSMYKKYIATENEKKAIEEILKLNYRKNEIEKKEKYGDKFLFNKPEEVKQNILPIEEKKKNVFEKIIEKIKSFFKQV